MSSQRCILVFVGLVCLISAAPTTNNRQKRQSIFFEDELDEQGLPKQGISTASKSGKRGELSRDAAVAPHSDGFRASAWGPPEFFHEQSEKGPHSSHGPRTFGHADQGFKVGHALQFHKGPLSIPQNTPKIWEFARGPVNEPWDQDKGQFSDDPGSWSQNHQPHWNEIRNDDNDDDNDYDGPNWDNWQSWFGNGQNNNGAWNNGNNQNWNGNSNGNYYGNGNNEAWRNGGAWDGKGNNQNSWSNGNINDGAWNTNWNNQNSWNNGNNNGGSWNGNHQRPNGNGNNPNSWWNNIGGSSNWNNYGGNSNASGNGNNIVPSTKNSPNGEYGKLRPSFALTGLRPPSTPRPKCDCPATGETNPVCGTDGNTYSNPSLLRCARSCGEYVQMQHYGACTSPAIDLRRWG